MPKAAIISSITFKRTSNVFINTGILGFKKYLELFMLNNSDRFPTLIIGKLTENELTIKCNNLIKLLEEVYYFMGKEVYDTPTQKQLDENHNVYYNEKVESFVRFPKMNTYGLTQLFTNNAQGTTVKPENSPKLKQLKKENPDLAEKIEHYYQSNGIKILAKVYLNEPYTKLTRLEFHPKYLTPGVNRCPLTGNSYKKLLEAKNISPFISGIANFNSLLSSSEKRISWIALYLIRFSPAMSYYSYQNAFDTLICYFFNSNNLVNLSKLYEFAFFRPREELLKINYQSNFKLFDFRTKRKDGEVAIVDTNRDAVWESEIAFMLLYTFYNKQFEGSLIDSNLQNERHFDPFENSSFETVPISLVSFRADKFASTMRPSAYEEFNNVKYIIRLIYQLEQNEVPFIAIWQGLKLNSSKAQALKSNSFQKGQALERQIRAAVFDHLFKGKTILYLIEKLFLDSYKCLISNVNPGFRRYAKILDFLVIFEQSINFGNNKNMNENLQQRSIKLGKSLSYAIIHFNDVSDSSTKKANAKNGRKYIIRLHKARTLEQFTEALISIMKKYGIAMSSELLEHLNKDNFLLIRQYTVISALNGLNSVLSSNSNEQ